LPQAGHFSLMKICSCPQNLHLPLLGGFSFLPATFMLHTLSISDSDDLWLVAASPALHISMHWFKVSLEVAVVTYSYQKVFSTPGEQIHSNFATWPLRDVGDDNVLCWLLVTKGSTSSTRFDVLSYFRWHAWPVHHIQFSWSLCVSVYLCFRHILCNRM